MRKGWIAALALVVALLAAEGGFRILEGPLGVDKGRLEGMRAFLRGDRLYYPRAYVNYVSRPPEEDADVHPRSWAFELLPHDEAPRVACLGGSTTWGLYPHFLDGFLELGLGGPVEVMNWGVPGWTSLETMVNYFVSVQDYEPDLVILLHAINDTNPRLFPGYRTDQAHWRTPWKEPDLGPLTRLLLHGSDLLAHLYVNQRNFQSLDTFTVRPPSPEPVLDALTNGSQRGFERNIRTITEHVRQHGGKVVLVTQPYSLAGLADRPTRPLVDQHNQFLRDLAAEKDYVLVEVERELAPLQADNPDMFTDHIHLSGKWQRREARQIAEEIGARGLLEAWRAPGPAR
jgi:hypothetical protein